MQRGIRPAASTRTRAVLAAAVVGLCSLVFAPLGPAAAQAPEDPDATSTTTTVGEPEPEPQLPFPTTSTPAPEEPTPPSDDTTPPPSNEPPPPPSEEPPPPPEGQQPSEAEAEVPLDVVVVPPPEGEVAPDPATPILQQIAGISLAEVQKGLAAAEQARQSAAGTTQTLAGSIGALELRLAELERDKAEAVARLQTARTQLKKRAVAGYMDSPAAPINQILASRDFNDLSRRFELLSSVIESDKGRINEYNAAREAVGSELEQIVTDLDAQRSSLTVAATVLDGADSALLAKQVQMAAVRAGNAVVGGGFVFPVAGPRSYADTFGAPRMFGTSYAHLHQGTDIFATMGTPLVAVERGVLIKVGTDVLGGNKLWIVGASGTRYYYAHMSAFAEGSVDGKVVSAGDVIGYVGNTGNAATTPPHVHFEVRPNGGAAVNPYPLLRIVEDAQKQIASQQPAPTTTGAFKS